MHIVTGATGNVGSVIVKELIARGEKVLAITHDALHVPKLKIAGADVAIVDIRNVEKLAEVFCKGSSLFLLNPPGDVSKDSVKIEKETVQCLLSAVAKTPQITKIVAESTQGAQPGENLGDLGVLYELERGLKVLNRPTRITRAAYYMTNWDMQDKQVQETGVLRSYYPIGQKIAMVSPSDLGFFNANQMLENFSDFSIQEVSGPEEYTLRDVRDQYERIYQKKVTIEVVPEADWVDSFKSMGFSEVSAQSYAAMTKTIAQEDYEPPRRPYRMPTTLRDHFDQKLFQRSALQQIMRPLQL